MSDKRKEELEDVKHLMSSDANRRTMYRFLQLSSVEHSTFDNDPYKHAYNAGRRDLGLDIRDELKTACPGSYLTMSKENEDG